MKKQNENSADKARIDGLLKEANKLHSSISRSESIETNKSKILEGDEEGIKAFSEGATSLKNNLNNKKEVILGIHEKLISPIWSIIKPLLSFIWRQYEKIWNRFAYSADRKSGLRRISRTKSSIVCVVFLLSLCIFTPTSIGDMVRFITVEPIVDSCAILVSKQTETFYLNHSEEIDPDANIHAVRGCRLRGACTEKDAVYFRVKPRLAHDVWKLINYGNPLYIPDHVVAPIAPGVNKCLVTYYGYRMTSSWISRLMRSLEFYPTMLEANCTYVGAQAEIDNTTSPALTNPQ